MAVVFDVDGIKNEVIPKLTKSKMSINDAKTVIASLAHEYQSQVQTISIDLEELEIRVKKATTWLEETVDALIKAEQATSNFSGADTTELSTIPKSSHSVNAQYSVDAKSILRHVAHIEYLKAPDGWDHSEVYGDLDGDGVVTALDATLASQQETVWTVLTKSATISDSRAVLKYALSMTDSLETPSWWTFDTPYGDFNGDGVVTTADAKILLRYAVGIESAACFSELSADVDPEYNYYMSKSGVLIVVVKNINTSYQVISAERMLNLVDSLEEKYAKHISVIQLVDYANPNDAYWAKEYNMPNFRSYATTSGHEDIQFYKNNKNSNNDKKVLGTLVHEAGHTMDRKLGEVLGLDTWFSSSATWTDAMAADLAHTGKSSPTEYGKTAIVEDFAESIEEYYYNPEAFHKQFPYRADIIKRIVFPNL